MKKWLCIFIALVIASSLMICASSAYAEGAGSEENGDYDPFDPANLDNGVAPELRHQYEEQSSMRMRGFAASSDARYINVLLSQGDAAQQDHTMAYAVFTGNYALCNDADEPLFKLTSDYEYTIALNGVNVELRTKHGTVLYSSPNGFTFKEYAPQSGQEYNYFKVTRVSNGTTTSDRIYRGELNCYYLTKTGLYNSKYLWTGLYLVNHVYIDDYLKGVISAEIGTSSPQAALEAQAVVARNYALRSKRTDGRVFDVYDYNLSQVYFGIYGSAASNAAVEATSARVLAYNGAAIKAYYGDSNGGFTEVSYNEWSGEGQSGPESVREDADDVLATSGTKYFEEITIPAADAGNSYFKSLVSNVLVYGLQSSGLTTATTENVTAASIAIANGPCYSYDSETRNITILQTKCRHHDGEGDVCSHFCSLNITFSGVTLDGVAQADYTATLTERDFFINPDNGRPLGFFRYSDPSHYWLFENRDDTGTLISYTLRHARHGSGVGLSQRGAIYKANHSGTVESILGFYFPGCDTQANSALSAGRTALEDISAASFEQDWRVLGSDAYVYAMSNVNSIIKGIIPAEECVRVARAGATWLEINYNGGLAYIRTECATREFTKVRITNVNQYINVRTEPNGAFVDAERAYPNGEYTLIESNSAAGWHLIQFASGKQRYISSRYSTLLTPAMAGDETALASYDISVSLPEGYTDDTLWVDGVPHKGTVSNGTLSVKVFTNNATNAVMYYYNAAGTPKGMRVWLLGFTGGAYSASYVPAFDDLLLYHGFSARIRGNSGIRFIGSIAQTTRSALLGAGVNGYKLVEYGTVSFHYPQYLDAYAFAISESNLLPTGYGKSYYAENGTVYDFIVSVEEGRIRFASVRIGIAPEDYDTIYPFRSYIKLNNGIQDIYIYGAPMSRDIYTIAKYYMGRGEYTPESEEGIFLNGIINYVESANN